MIRSVTMNLGAALIAMSTLGHAGLAQAHHSFAMFDGGKLATLEGTIYAVELKSPHSWFWLAIPNDKGGTDIWGLEMASAGGMVRIGMTKKDLVVGSKVTVDIHPLKDGRPGGQFLRVTFPDGRQFGSLETAVDTLKNKGYVQ